MKKIYRRLAFLAMLAFAGGCGNNFLDITPETSITVANFWKSAQDIKLYANAYYENKNWFPKYNYSVGNIELDATSDNLIKAVYDPFLNGENKVPTTEEMNYLEVYKLNYFLENYQNGGIKEDEVAHYVGETYFFRAYSYFTKLKRYGDVQWVGRTVAPGDAELYVGRSPRNVVADYILADLTEAARLLSSKSTMTERRVTKEVALLLKSRVALFEGTWEKYHNGTKFGVQNPDWDKYFRIAVAAGDDLFELNTQELDNVGAEEGYADLFRQSDYSSSKEIMLFRNFYDGSAGGNNVTSCTESNRDMGITQSLVDAYLDARGMPRRLSTLNLSDATLFRVVQNRDPRLAQTIFVPGYKVYKKDQPRAGLDTMGYRTFRLPTLGAGSPDRNMTGYQIYKGHDNASTTRRESFRGVIATIYFRYAEALLNYAEAKAELGELSQDDLGKTINLLRKRVGMPDMIIGAIPDDPERSELFPEVGALIYEIRRERRVELALEGFRPDDLRRWAAYGKLIKDWKPKGASWGQWATSGVQIEGLTGVADTVSSDILKNYVEVDGHIAAYQTISQGVVRNPLPLGYQPRLDRDYLYPYPLQEIQLNPGKVYQNPGW